MSLLFVNTCAIKRERGASGLRKGYVFANVCHIALHISTELTIGGSCKVLFSTHVNHMSVSPTKGIGPTQGQRNTLTRVEIVFLCPCVVPIH